MMKNKHVLVCYDCCKEKGLLNEYQNSVLHVLAGQDGPKCHFCNQDNGGADIILRTKI